MNNKLRILFDASVLDAGINKNANRSGIYFVAYNLLLEFLRRTDVEVYIYARLESINAVDEVLNTLPHELYIKIFFSPFFIHLKRKYVIHDKFEKITKKINNTSSFIRKNLLRLYRKYCFLRIARNGIGKKAEYLADYDVYFSPAFATPDFIYKDSIFKFTTLHDTICLKFPHYYPAMKYEFWYKTLIKQINKSDYYFPNSDNTRKDFIGLGKIDPKKTFTAYLSACDSTYYPCLDDVIIHKIKNKYNIPVDKNYILSLCSLEPRKNLIFAVKGFVELIKKNKIDDLIFVLGGGHWDEFLGLLENEIADLGLFKDKIIRAGYVDDEDLAALYSNAIIFTYPTLYEGFGLPVLEAMKCGVPVVTSNKSSIPEVAGDAAIMVDPNDLDEYVNALEKLYFNANYREMLIKKGFEQANKFSWQKTAETMTTIMKQVCLNKSMRI